MEIPKYVKELLPHYERVIVPGLGGFITTKKPAQIDNVQGIIFPPSVSVAFNRDLTANDGLLIHHASNKEGISYAEAEEKVRKFVEGTNRLLASGEVITFPGIGKLHADPYRKMVFIAEPRNHFLLSAYGLQPLHFSYATKQRVVEKVVKENLPPIVEEKVATPEEIKPTTKRKIRTNRRATYKKGLLVSVMLMVGLSQFIIWDVSPEKLSLNNLDIVHFGLPASAASSTSTLADRNLVEHTPLILTEEASAELRMEVADIDNTRVEVTPTSTANTTGYYGIVASFKERKNAQKMIDKLEKQQMNVHFLPAPNGYTRIGVYLSADEQSAMQQLGGLKRDIEPSAWLVFNQDK